MCGLFFVVERARAVGTTRARQAIAALRHRGPDGIGEYAFERSYQGSDGTVAVSGFVGHTRLSILDPSTLSSQPFRRGAHTLAYNGEIYNFRALREELSRDGCRFETDGDTEVLMALLARQGADGLNRANGMWAFCLLDENAGLVTAARDRYGKKPLFYYSDASTLCMASEISPILAYLGRAPEFVQTDLDSFLRDGWLFPHANGDTHLRGIRQVVAGGVLTFDLANWNLQEHRYFDLAQYASSAPHDAANLAVLVQDAVLARLVADRKVGLLLSGGVDSSLILSVLHSQGLSDNVTCFTGDAGKSDDASYARMCIEQLGIRAVNVPLDYSATSMDAFLQVCRHQEKPFPFIGNALAMPQLYAQIASHDVPVVLDGTGGDEIFAGYWDRYYRFALAQALAAGDDRWIAESIAANADDPKLRAITHQALRNAQSTSGHGARPQGITRSLEDPLDLDSFVEPAVRQAPCQDVLQGFAGSLAQALVADAAQGRLHEWLWQNDRNAMMSGIENRSPLLDYRLAPYMQSSYREKFVGGWNKHELRLLFPAFVQLPTQWRRDKQGFRWVYGRFLRSNRAKVLELIDSSRILPERVQVLRLLDAARKDDAYLGCGLLHRMLCVAGLELTMGMVSG
jgi:asparagine synthase (glutamine-hydrolysing)